MFITISFNFILACFPAATDTLSLTRRTPKLALGGGGTQVQQTVLLSFRQMNDVPNESPFAEIQKQLHTANDSEDDADGIRSYP